VLTDTGSLAIEVPRDRAGSFEPQLIGKHERRFTGFDDKIIAMYARGMTVREIQGYLAEMYTVEVSPELISKVTDVVMSEVTARPSRPLETMYPVVFFDALQTRPTIGACSSNLRDQMGGFLRGAASSNPFSRPASTLQSDSLERTAPFHLSAVQQALPL
jgi:Transposase, Mutator family